MAANRVELELSLNWADLNPTAYTESVKKFMADYRDWKIIIDATRKHYVTFIALLRDK